MIKFKDYVRAQSLEEAYTLCQKKRNVVLGGMLWLKMQKRSAGTAIDLCDLGLNYIEETPEEFRIGAMTTLRQLEKHEGLNTLTNYAMEESVKHIVGVQFRNVATLGGSLFGRFGFSDVLTLFQVLDAKVELYHAGVMSVSEFAELPRKTRDILVQVIVPKKNAAVAYQSMRNTATDFPVLTCAVSYDGSICQCAVGARPAKAVAITDTQNLLKDGITARSAEAFAVWAADQFTYGSNIRGSEAYRKKICQVLVRRTLMEAAEKVESKSKELHNEMYREIHEEIHEEIDSEKKEI